MAGQVWGTANITYTTPNCKIIEFGEYDQMQRDAEQMRSEIKALREKNEMLEDVVKALLASGKAQPQSMLFDQSGDKPKTRSL